MTISTSMDPSIGVYVTLTRQDPQVSLLLPLPSYFFFFFLWMDGIGLSSSCTFVCLCTFLCLPLYLPPSLYYTLPLPSYYCICIIVHFISSVFYCICICTCPSFVPCLLFCTFIVAFLWTNSVWLVHEGAWISFYALHAAVFNGHQSLSFVDAQVLYPDSYYVFTVGSIEITEPSIRRCHCLLFAVLWYPKTLLLRWYSVLFNVDSLSVLAFKTILFNFKSMSLSLVFQRTV